MYKKADRQISIEEFISPFGKLNPKNRWVKIADLIPWQKYEEKYAEQFCENNGAPAIKFRMVLGTLIIKQRTKHSDEEVLQDILENPYMQYLIGLQSFTETAPFTSASITNFRKYVSAEMINAINEDLFRAIEEQKDDDNAPGNGTSGRTESETDTTKQSPAESETGTTEQPPTESETGTTGQTPTKSETETAKQPPIETKPTQNKGTVMLDATCAPAYLRYPTDVSLLNESREKLEVMIDVLHPTGTAIAKPRTYRENARDAYLEFAKQRKPSQKAVRKAIGKQLRFVKRDLKHVDWLIQEYGIDGLSQYQQQCLAAIRILYLQQQEMYDERKHSVANRVVSIGQPHVRPIVRGKANAPVEFGAKINVCFENGYAFIDKLSWDAFNEESQLVAAVERYKELHGYYPEAVLADQIYRNRDNRAYCKEHGIRLSGPRLGRPPKEKDLTVIRQTKQDASQRNAIEGKFGEGKTKYGLDRIMARLKDSSEAVIAISFFCMNLSRKLRFLLRFFSDKVHFRFSLAKSCTQFVLFALPMAG